MNILLKQALNIIKINLIQANKIAGKKILTEEQKALK